MTSRQRVDGREAAQPFVTAGVDDFIPWASSDTLRLLEAAPVAMVVVDASGAILYANTRLADMFGYENGELIGQRIELLLPERFRGVHVAHRTDYMKKPRVRPMGSGMDLAGRHKDGGEFPIEAGLSHVKMGDRPLVLCSIADLSRRKQAEEVLEDRVRQRTRELERRRQVADGLRDILTILNSDRPPEEILDHMVVQATALLYADAAAIYSIEAEGVSPILKAVHGISEEQLVLANSGGDDESVLDYVLVDERAESNGPDGRRMHLTTIRRPHWNPDGEALLHVGFRALLSVPLIVKDEVFGSLMLYYAKPRKFSPEEIELAGMVGDQAALAIENARLRSQAERTAVAAERSRIARDLHDSVTQTLFSATLIAEVLPKIWQRDLEESTRRLEELRQLTRGALAEMRALLLELRPATLVEVEIGDLLRQLVEAAIGRARLPIRLEIEGECLLPPDVKISLYHIAQEALNNVAKHARARQALVSLHCDRAGAVLIVRDDGRGFVLGSVTAAHLGLTIMRERAQSIGAGIDIESRLDEGTTVRVAWQASAEAAGNHSEGEGHDWIS